MSKTIEIVGAKLVGGLFCHYKFREDIGKGRHDTLTVKSERPAHEDLVNAFRALAIHLPVIMQDVKPSEVEDINSDVNNYRGSDAFRELLEKFTVLEVEREIEEARAMLVGTKLLDLGVFGVETPMIRYQGAYHFRLEFQFAIDTLMNEVQLYREGKQAPEVQQPELFATGDGEGDGEEKPIKKRRTKKSPLEGTTVTMTSSAGSVTMSGEEFDDRIGILAGNEGEGDKLDEFNQPLSHFKIPPEDVKD